MKSYDIFVDRHLIQGDLIVVSLPLRNDIAAYSWLVVDGKIPMDMTAKKIMSLADNAGGIVIGARYTQ